MRRAAEIVRCISAIWKAKSESISMDQLIASELHGGAGGPSRDRLRSATQGITGGALWEISMAGVGECIPKVLLTCPVKEPDLE